MSSPPSDPNNFKGSKVPKSPASDSDDDDQDEGDIGIEAAFESHRLSEKPKPDFVESPASPKPLLTFADCIAVSPRKISSPTGKNFTPLTPEKLAAIKTRGEKKQAKELWVFSWSQVPNAGLKNLPSHIKANLTKLGWTDMQNSSYYKWTETVDLQQLLKEAASAIIGYPESPQITNITFLHANNPIDYSQDLVDVLRALLGPNNINVNAT
jgi:hypothetical protein